MEFIPNKSFSEGYMAAVAQVTHSSIDVSFVIELGKRKAGRFDRNNFKMFQPIPIKPLLTEYDKGWIEGLSDTFKALIDGEITIDKESDNYMPLQVIESLINHGFKEAEAVIKEDYKRAQDLEAYKKKEGDNYKKYPPHPNQPNSPHMYPPFDKKTKESYNEKAKEESRKRKLEEYRKNKFNDYHDKTHPTDRP